MNYKISIDEAVEQLKKEKDFPFIAMMHHGTLSVEYFAPKKVDTQEPHKQDEIYVIVSGYSVFYCGGRWMDCKKGDLIFVPAGMEHRFQNFSDDFATWVIFYGPDGGEKE
ncbi:MAG TPA: cupin domain-containing protein [Chitinophagaceae bacterium]|nr:cupin domain-containing protein [Chitinophagaceae bacterium]